MYNSVEAFGTKPICPFPISWDLLSLSVMMGFIQFLMTAWITLNIMGLIVSNLILEISFLAYRFLVRGTILEVYNFYCNSLFLKSSELIVRWISLINYLQPYRLSGKQSTPAALHEGLFWLLDLLHPVLYGLDLVQEGIKDISFTHLLTGL